MRQDVCGAEEVASEVDTVDRFARRWLADLGCPKDVVESHAQLSGDREVWTRWAGWLDELLAGSDRGQQHVHYAEAALAVIQRAAELRDPELRHADICYVHFALGEAWGRLMAIREIAAGEGSSRGGRGSRKVPPEMVRQVVAEEMEEGLQRTEARKMAAHRLKVSVSKVQKDDNTRRPPSQ